MSSFIPVDERVVTIEDSAELLLQQHSPAHTFQVTRVLMAIGTVNLGGDLPTA